MRVKKFKTKMLGLEPTGSAHDVDFHANSLDNDRVIFSFDSAEDRDNFLTLMKAAMEATNCWAGLEIRDKVFNR